MQKNTPLRIAVIGRNVSAALCALDLCRRPQARVTWLQTAFDRVAAKSPYWVILPWPRLQKVGVAEAKRFDHPPFFFKGAYRIPLTDSSVPAVVPGRGELPAGLRQKLVALALRDDHSPPLWNMSSSGRFTPNPDWLQAPPLAWEQEAGIAEPWIVGAAPASALFEVLEARVSGAGADILHENRVAIGVQVPRGRGQRVVLNAPYGFVESDALVWVSAGAPLTEEADRSHRRLRPLRERPLGVWQNYCARVPKGLVSGLPPFSIWVDERAAPDFLATALPTEGCLKRVLVVDDGKDVMLQIQSLSFLGADVVSVVPDRPDEFLWDFCPYLREAEVRFESFHTEHDIFFEDPLPRQHTYGRDVYFWNAGSYGEAAEALQTRFPFDASSFSENANP